MTSGSASPQEDDLQLIASHGTLDGRRGNGESHRCSHDHASGRQQTREVDRHTNHDQKESVDANCDGRQGTTHSRVLEMLVWANGSAKSRARLER